MPLRQHSDGADAVAVFLLSQIWDYSISQATLETIFMSFAKDQEEEVASVPGEAYTSSSTTITEDSADENKVGDGGTLFDEGRRSAQGARNPRAPSMDVEMAYLGGARRDRLRSTVADTQM